MCNEDRPQEFQMGQRRPSRAMVSAHSTPQAPGTELLASRQSSPDVRIEVGPPSGSPSPCIRSESGGEDFGLVRLETRGTLLAPLSPSTRSMAGLPGGVPSLASSNGSRGSLSSQIASWFDANFHWKTAFQGSSRGSHGQSPTIRRRWPRGSLNETHSPRRDKQMNRFVNNVQEQFLRATMLPAGSIDRELGEVRASFRHVALSSVFFSSRPIAAALSKRPLRLFLLMWAVVLVVDCYFGIAEYLEDRRSPTNLRGVSGLRLIPIELRNGQTEGIAGTGLSALGITLADDPCPKSGANFTHLEDGAVEVYFEEPEDGHGVMIATGHGPPELDVVRFEVLSLQGREWKPAVMSGWEHDWDAALVLYHGKFRTPEQRGKAVVMFTGVSTGWLLGLTGTSMATACGFMAVVALAVLRREHQASRVFLGMLVLDAALLLAAAGMVEDFSVYRVSFALQGVCLGLLCALLVLRERHLLVYTIILGVCYIGWGVYEAAFSRPYLAKSSGFHMSLGGGLIAVTLWTLLLRRRTISSSTRLVAPDKAAYDSLWSAIRGKAEEEGGLARLQRAEGAVRRDGEDPPPPRQLNRRRAVGAGEAAVPCPVDGALEVGIPGSVEETQPVKSLDQLYAQAAGVRPAMLLKVQGWCLASGGQVPLKAERGGGRDGKGGGGEAGGGGGEAGGEGATGRRSCEKGEGRAGGMPDLFEEECYDGEEAVDWSVAPLANLRFVKWSTLQGDWADRDGVLWAKNKSLSRAIEKTLRSYRGDPSYLLDLCRQSIVFDHVAELATCLEAITSDPEVMVVRIKNRFRDDYDSAVSAGYRDVAVNIRIINEATCALGVDTHICELQLILMPFARMKGEEGHARYVVFRNARGE